MNIPNAYKRQKYKKINRYTKEKCYCEKYFQQKLANSTKSTTFAQQSYQGCGFSHHIFFTSI